MIKQYYTAYKARTMCPVCSEEEEILAFGEAFLFKPGGKIYLTLRTRTRIHGLTLIAGARCSSDSY